MVIYLKLGRVRGLSIEINKEFGTKPFFKKKYFATEMIIDIPYTQFVFTPSNWNPNLLDSKRKLSHGNNKIGQISKCVKRINAY